MALSGCAIDKDSFNFLFKKAGEVSVSTQSKPDKPKPAKQPIKEKGSL